MRFLSVVIPILALGFVAGPADAGHKDRGKKESQSCLCKHFKAGKHCKKNWMSLQKCMQVYEMGPFELFDGEGAMDSSMSEGHPCLRPMMSYKYCKMYYKKMHMDNCKCKHKCKCVKRHHKHKKG